jgi:hypothetical protein
MGCPSSPNTSTSHLKTRSSRRERPGDHKFEIDVACDTDRERARKLLTRVCREMTADPEIAHNILRLNKMQGVEQLPA